jgi:hypothetical protein
VVAGPRVTYKPDVNLDRLAEDPNTVLRSFSTWAGTAAASVQVIFGFFVIAVVGVVIIIIIIPKDNNDTNNLLVLLVLPATNNK